MLSPWGEFYVILVLIHIVKKGIDIIGNEVSPVQSTTTSFLLQDDPDEPDCEPTAPRAPEADTPASSARRQADLRRRSLMSLAIERDHEKPYRCRICSRRVRDRTTAIRHVMSHLSERPFQCAQCGKGFLRKEYLDTHLKQHAGERPYPCFCGYSAVTASALAAHSKTHSSGPKPVQCDRCDKTFRKQSDLAIHVRSHTGERPFRCRKCPRAFASASKLNMHVRLKHSVSSNSRSQTGDGENLNTTSENSSRSEDGSSERVMDTGQRGGSVCPDTDSATKNFCCDRCGVQFTRASALRRHQSQHSSPPAFSCAQCEKRFRSAAALASHERVHTGERPYQCDVCQKRFALRSTLTSHQRRHTGDKPFRCKLCPRAFAQATPLKRHLQSHGEAGAGDVPGPTTGCVEVAVAGLDVQRGGDPVGVTVKHVDPRTMVVSGTQPPSLPPLPKHPSEAAMALSAPAGSVGDSLVSVMESFTPLPQGERSQTSGGGIDCVSGVFHELQPLNEILRCPLCPVHLASKRGLDDHMKGHLTCMGTQKGTVAQLTTTWE